jgi:hypothetical protein
VATFWAVLVGGLAYGGTLVLGFVPEDQLVPVALFAGAGAAVYVVFCAGAE